MKTTGHFFNYQLDAKFIYSCSFSTATVAARTRLNVTLYVNCMFCLILGSVMDRNVNLREGHTV
jgi:hypothetical protein